jgi:hypothetical protein
MYKKLAGKNLIDTPTFGEKKEKKNLCALNGENLECQHQSYRPANAAAAVSLF